MIDVEGEFRRLIAFARVLPTRLEDEFASNRDLSMVHVDDFPTVTVLKRLHWASVQFESAVVLLEDYRTAHGCMLLLRGLLEVWADFLFIADKDDADEQRKRSIAVELAAAQQMVHTFSIKGIAYLSPNERKPGIRERDGRKGTRGNRGGASQLARVSALSRPGRTTWSGASQAKTVGQRCDRPARWCGGQGRSRLELSVLT